MALGSFIAGMFGNADRSTHANVVEYGAQEMMKGKSPRAAARATARKLSGGANMFLDSPTEPVDIDPVVLESALWGRLVDNVLRGAASFRPGMEHFALDATLAHFQQSDKLRGELKARAIERAGRNLFVNDDR